MNKKQGSPEVICIIGVICGSESLLGRFNLPGLMEFAFLTNMP